MDSRKIARFGIITALYVVLTQATLGLAFGPFQFRVSEMLTLLAFIDPFYLAPLTLGCAIVNLSSPFGMIDVIFGSLASFLALKFMTKSKNIYIASLWPSVFSFIVGLEILLLSSEPVNFFLVTGQIMVSQFIIVSLIGVPIFKNIINNSQLVEIIKDI